MGSNLPKVEVQVTCERVAKCVEAIALPRLRPVPSRDQVKKAERAPERSGYRCSFALDDPQPSQSWSVPVSDEPIRKLVRHEVEVVPALHTREIVVRLKEPASGDRHVQQRKQVHEIRIE
jgi:hypothetical protein